MKDGKEEQLNESNLKGKNKCEEQRAEEKQIKELSSQKEKMRIKKKQNPQYRIMQNGQKAQDNIKNIKRMKKSREKTE